METRIGKAWGALLKRDTIWKSNLSNQLKIKFFQATVESVLLYGTETWTLTKEICNRLDGNCTRMLRVVLSVSWRAHMTNKELYGKLLRTTEMLKERRLRFAGHSWRRKEEVTIKLLLWEPIQGKRKRGRPAKTYVGQLKEDTRLTKEELAIVMNNRDD